MIREAKNLCNVGGEKMLLTESEAAKRLGISRMALLRLRKSGKVGYVYYGRRGFRYTPEQLSAWIATASKDATHG